MLKQSKFFYLAVTLSLLLHALLILGLKFKPDYSKYMRDKIPPLEVILLNQTNSTPPKQAQLLAQTNHDNDSAQAIQPQNKAEPVVSEPIPEKKVVAKVKRLSRQVEKVQTESREQQQQVKKLETQAAQLLNQIQSPSSVNNTPAPTPNANEAAAPSRKLNLDASNLIANNEEINRAESQIARQQEDYQKRPRRKSVGVRTQEYKFAIYVEAWRQKVERIGNLNYPTAAREQKLYGSLQMTVYIKSDGSLEKVEIRRSSGQRLLDDAARRIVELAAPYAPFPEDIRKEVDILDITRTWTFTKEDNFNGGE